MNYRQRLHTRSIRIHRILHYSKLNGEGHQPIGLHAILAAMNGISVERFHDHMTRPYNIVIWTACFIVTLLDTCVSKDKA